MRILATIIFIFTAFTACAQKYLFIGTDSRNPQVEERSNSDMIMIMQINQKGIKMASIMRDTYVDIPGKGKDKINAAYRFGGHSLLIKTINQNFDLGLKNYVIIDFVNAPEAIDSLGGVTVNVDEQERVKLNQYIAEQNIYNPRKYEDVLDTGNIKLNGGQALAYCRIRIDGDRNRTSRQQEVLKNAINDVWAHKDFKKILALKKFFKSDMPFSAFTNLAQNYLLAYTGGNKSNMAPVSKSFPLATQSRNRRMNNVDYVVADIPKTKLAIKNFFLK